MKTLEQFIQFYQQRGYLDMGTTIRKPSKPLNERQIKTAYDQYVRKTERQKQKQSEKRNQPMSKDAELSIFVRKRDGNQCRLLRLLTPREYALWKEHYGGQDTVDAAHVFGKGAHPWMRYDPDNIVCLNRFSHLSLDTYRNPLTGSTISKEEHEMWWKRIIGGNVYNELLDKSYKE